MVKELITNFYNNRFFVIILVIHLFLLCNISFFPYPELFIYPYLKNNGLAPYKQIFDQHFPGVMFFSVNLDSIGIDTPAEMQLVQLLLVASTHLLIYFVSKKLLSKSHRLLPNFLYLLWQPFFEGYVLWIDSFMPLFLLSSFYFFQKFSTQRVGKWIFFSGFLLGLALLFKQVLLPIIVVLFIYILLSTKSIKNTTYFSLGVLIPACYLLYYVVNIGVFAEFFYWTVTFNITTFAELGRKYASFNDLIKSGLVFGTGFVGVYYLLRNRWRNKHLVLVLYFISSLSFAYARFDFVHLQPALPFALIILSLCFQNISRHKEKLAIGYLMLTIPLIVYFYKNNFGQDVYFFTDTENKVLERVKDLTNSGDTIFAFATFPHIYKLSDTLPPGKVFVFHFPWFMLETQVSILSGIKRDNPKLVIKDSYAITDNKILIDYMKDIDDYIDDNYKLLEVHQGIEMWVPK